MVKIGNEIYRVEFLLLKGLFLVFGYFSLVRNLNFGVSYEFYSSWIFIG